MGWPSSSGWESAGPSLGATSTPEGSRNDHLNRAAFALGQLIAGGELSEIPALTALEQAGLSIGLEPRETRATIESGIAAGKLQPRRRPGR